MDIQQLSSTAAALVAPGKGILAADESTGTIKKRFDSINVESTEESRLKYREMLFRTKGAAEFISGVILYDETLRQNSALDGTPLVQVLEDQGIEPWGATPEFNERRVLYARDPEGNSVELSEAPPADASG